MFADGGTAAVERCLVKKPYNKLLTNRAIVARAVLGNIGPRANIPQYGPRARLVRSYYCATSKFITSMTWAVLNLTRCVERYDFCR